MKINFCHDSSAQTHVTLISYTTAHLKLQFGLEKVSFWCPCIGNKAYFKESDAQIKKTTAGCKKGKKKSHAYLGFWCGLQSETCRSEKTSYQTFTESKFCLPRCLLTSPSPQTISHLAPMGHFV